MKIFQLILTQQGIHQNVPDDLEQRIKFLKDLKDQGYTHVKVFEQWDIHFPAEPFSSLHGAFFTIDDFIDQERSYL